MNLSEESQKKYMELQFLDQQIKQLQQQLMGVNQQVMELKKIDDDLTEFEKVKEDSKMFFALGPGIFAEGTLTNKDLLLNVGSSVLVKKPIMETKKLISIQVQELENILVKMQDDLQVAGLRGQELQQDIMAINQDTKKDK